MKILFAAACLAGTLLSSAQSLHFVSDNCIPFGNVASSLLGRITEPRIDVLRSKRDWDEYYSAQNGFFGGPAITSLIQPDFCREQVVAVNLGGDGTFGKIPLLRTVRVWDECTWEVVVELCEPLKNPMSAPSMFSPFIAVRTPIGPDNYRFVFVTAEGRQVIDLRSAPNCCVLPRDWWRCHDSGGRGRR